MNKQEILNEIEKTKEHLANMRKMLEECGYERWKPEYDKPYWFVNPMGQAEITCNTGSTFHELTVGYYNCFQTKEQAEAEAEKILVSRMLEDIARRLNKGQKIDWNNEDQNKYFICSNHWQDTIILEHGWKNKFCGVVYCLDENFKDIAIQEIGEERLKKYLGGE